MQASHANLLADGNGNLVPAPWLNKKPPEPDKVLVFFCLADYRNDIEFAKKNVFERTLAGPYHFLNKDTIVIKTAKEADPSFNWREGMLCMEIQNDYNRLSKCPNCGYYAFDGSECLDCGFKR